MFLTRLKRTTTPDTSECNRGHPLRPGYGALGSMVLALGACVAPSDASAVDAQFFAADVRVERVEKFHKSPAMQKARKVLRGIFGGPGAIGRSFNNQLASCSQLASSALADGYWVDVHVATPASDDMMVLPAFMQPVGYINFINDEARFNRCRVGTSRTYVTRFKFDLSRLGGPEEVRIEKAVMAVPERNINRATRRRRLPERCQSATDIVEMNTEPYSAGWPRKHEVDEHKPPERLSDRVRKIMPGNIVQDATMANGFMGQIEMDITEWVQAWHRGRVDNHGISLYGHEFDYARENEECVGDALTPVLRVEFE